MRPAELRLEREAQLRKTGAILYWAGMGVGGFLLTTMVGVSTLFSKRVDVEIAAMFIGAVFALPMLLLYVWVPWIIDRYDPEPARALLMALSWGAIAACGFSGLVNSTALVFGNVVGGTGNLFAATISAPLVEEATKGMAILFMYFFWRRHFDGVVDGVVYGTFAALGFAAVENVLYYGMAAKAEMITHKEGIFAGTFLVRGILSPWGHPLFTSMTGLGFGIARETSNPLVKWLAPLGGYGVAVSLHSLWNGVAAISNALLLLMLPLWFFFVLAFFILVLWLVWREGRIIHDHLKDEVLLGNLTPWELALVTSPVAAIRATLEYGGASGRRFVAAAVRLALSKWHADRAMQGQLLTVSSDLVRPLRQEIRRLRGEVSRSLGRPVEEPSVLWAEAAPPPSIPVPAEETP